MGLKQFYCTFLNPCSARPADNQATGKDFREKKSQKSEAASEQQLAELLQIKLVMISITLLLECLRFNH